MTCYVFEDSLEEGTVRSMMNLDRKAEKMNEACRVSVRGAYGLAWEWSMRLTSMFRFWVFPGVRT